MKTYRTRSGRVLTDEDIEALAEKAERTYDIELFIRTLARDEAQKVLEAHLAEMAKREHEYEMFDAWRTKG